MHKAKCNYEEINKKQLLLATSREILKSEFVGIDSVIDKEIESISTWFTFPELQEAPVVINLWGMTSVGKTALVARLADLLKFENKFFRYDMGNDSVNSTTLKDNLDNISEHTNGMPCIIVLDEFQYAKTKDERDDEIDNHYTRIVWDLLDSGNIQAWRYYTRELGLIVTLRNLLNYAINADVKVSDRIVKENEAVSSNL